MVSSTRRSSVAVVALLVLVAATTACDDSGSSDGVGLSESPEVGGSAPSAVPDEFSLPRGSSASLLDVLANDTDPDGDTLTVIDVDAPSGGGLAAIDGALIEYTPQADFVGVETFTYTIYDGTSSSRATVTVEVFGTTPVAVADDFTVDQDSGPVLLDVLGNDRDPNGDTLSITDVGAPSGGGLAAIDGALIEYTPPPDFVGMETFQYTIGDGTEFSSALVSVDVRGAPPGEGVARFLQSDQPDCFLVVEAESYHEKIAETGGSAEWIEATAPTNGHSGDGAMVVSPRSAAAWEANFDPDAPQLRYRIEAVTSATLSLWTRGFNNGTRDSVHVALDHGEVIADNAIFLEQESGYTWNKSRRTIVVTAGSHELIVQAREADTVIDKVVLTCDSSWRPDGVGPPESPQTNTPPVFDIADASHPEGDFNDTNAVFIVTLSKASETPTSVAFSTSDLSAIAGEDYLATSGVLDFPSGETVRSIPVTVLADTDEEGDETFEVILSAPVGGDLGDAQGVGMIVGDDVPPSGLDVRPDNRACVFPSPPSSGSGVELVNPYPDLSLHSTPITLVHPPGDDSTWYVLERPGRIRVVENDPSVDSTRLFLNITSKVVVESESGLEGFAFHPNWPKTLEAFVTYTEQRDPDAATVNLNLSRFQSTDGGFTLNRNTEEVVITLESQKRWHFGSRIRFGPFDDFLYWGIGDFNTRANSQNLDVLPGSFVRIDVDGTSRYGPYGIPPDNPYVAGGGRPEIWAYGFRNPWGFGFDRVTGDLWCGDVGGVDREEVDLVEKGGNYGWNVLQGNLCQETAEECNNPIFVPPVLDMKRENARCVIGGFVYRGSAIPELYGVYIFADWWLGTVKALRYRANGVPYAEILYTHHNTITSFEEDDDGELFLTSGLEILKLAPAAGGGGGGVGDSFPQQLSDVPCVDPDDPAQPLPGMIPYDINVPFWSDSATKERYFAIPDGETIEILPDGDFAFPSGTVFMKNFFLDARIVETRFLVRHNSGTWAGYSYEWNAGQTDASLLDEGKTVMIDGKSWTFPSRGECRACHTGAANFVLGAEILQLNRDFTYSSTGRTANQLSTLEQIGLFDTPLPARPSALPALPETDDLSASVSERARAYLHSNCSNCHRPGTNLPVDMDMRFDTVFADMQLCNVLPAETFDLPNVNRITPGDPATSMVQIRLEATGPERMPPIGKNLVDGPGALLIDEWIQSILSCP